jgi:polysaccharide biosynthesis/export protein
MTGMFMPVLVVGLLLPAVPVLAQAQAPAGTTLAAPPPSTPTPAQPAAAKPVVPGEITPPPGYVIGAEDVLAIVFWREKDLTVDAAVRPDGRITVPLINDVQAAGLTPDQLREQIQAAAAKFVTDPSVTVVVKTINSRKVFITGMVSKPGQYPLAGPTSVMQLIAMAGGLNEFADSEKVLIMRTEKGQQVAKRFNYDDVREGKNLQQNIELLPGDTVVVP